MYQHAHLTSSYNPALVLLSYIVALVAAYTALNLSGRVAAARGRTRTIWLVSSAAALGGGIWSMHFTGMLAHSVAIPVEYDITLVLVSLVVAVAASLLAFGIVGSAALSLRRLLIGGPLIGLGIASMHYIGMASMQMAATIRYDLPLFALSIIIAIGAATTALWMLFHLRGDAPLQAHRPMKKLASALVMGLAITGMHYTGMAAAAFVPIAGASPAALSGSNALLLGIGVGLITLVIQGLALIAVFVDRRFAHNALLLSGAEQRHSSLFEHNPNAVFELDRDGICHAANASAARLAGYAPAMLHSRSFMSLMAAEDREQVRQHVLAAAGGTPVHTEVAMQHEEGARVMLSITTMPVVVAGEIVGVYSVAQDVTARWAAEQAVRHSEAELRTLLGQQQQLLSTIRALSTPVLPVRDDVLVLPLIGHIDSERCQQMLTTVLNAVERQRARLVLLDITGVPLVDTAVAGYLVQAAQAIKLLGAQCILVGVSPEVAQTVVQLGVDLSALTTYRDLSAGISYALAHPSRNAG